MKADIVHLSSQLYILQFNYKIIQLGVADLHELFNFHRTVELQVFKILIKNGWLYSPFQGFTGFSVINPKLVRVPVMRQQRLWMTRDFAP